MKKYNEKERPGNKLIAGTGFVVSASDIVIFLFTPAVAGDADNVNGTAGALQFRVTPSGVTPSAYSSGTITATVFDTTSNDVIDAATFKAWTVNGTLYVSGLSVGETYSVYNVSGALIFTGIANSDRTEIALSGRGVYIVRNATKAVKVIN